MAYYHKQTRALVAEPARLPAELLRQVREALPEEDRYGIKFVMFPVNQGMSGNMDVQNLVEMLQKLGMWQQAGVSLSTFHEAIGKIEEKMPKEEKAVQIQLPNIPAPVLLPDPPKNKPKAVNPAVKPVLNGQKAPTGRLHEGMRVEVVDKRRKQVGVIQSVVDTEAVVFWKSGNSRKISLSRLLNPRKYILG